VTEAVGQLAAWVAMAKAEFRSRPVAGIAGEVKYKDMPAPGTILDLKVDLESCQADSILYDGWAFVGDVPIIELSRCVGPMLPMEDFDDPIAVRRRFELLCGAEASLQGFSGDAALTPRLTFIHRDRGTRLRAKMVIPKSAPFFADHFPRKPVFPGTLLLDAKVRIAASLAAEAVDPSIQPLLRPIRIYNVKLRSFVLPGQALEIDAKVLTTSRASTKIALAAEVEGQRVSTARVEVGLLEGS
jgi:3-hydroxymyristoyl/3-hydroxydecanoyl-(acyl carrier protein) dehydratase